MPAKGLPVNDLDDRAPGAVDVAVTADTPAPADETPPGDEVESPPADVCAGPHAIESQLTAPARSNDEDPDERERSMSRLISAGPCGCKGCRAVRHSDRSGHF